MGGPAAVSSKDRRKKASYPGRPFMLGTDEILPPMRVPFQMWSQSSDPHQCGLVQFEFTNEGLAVRWYGDSDVASATLGSFSANASKQVIEWHELAWMAGQLPRDVEAEIEWIKQKAETEAARHGVEIAVGILRDWHDKITGDKPVSPFMRPLIERCCVLLEKHQATSPPTSPPSPSPQSPAA